ncbi:hypothetical protein ACI2IP_17165 [Microbacterium sp. NPDC090218]
MNTIARASGLALIVALAVGASAGCAATPGSASPSDDSSPSSSPTATPTSTPEPPAEDPTDPSTWIIDEDGVGPIDVGGDFAATLGVLGENWKNDTATCSWMASWTAPDNGYGMYFVRGTESDAAPIREVSVYSAAEAPVAVTGPATVEGLGIGSTVAEVLAAYPDAQEGTPTIGSGTWLMLPGDADAHVFFEFREGGDAAWDVTVTTGAEPSYEVCG